MNLKYGICVTLLLMLTEKASAIEIEDGEALNLAIVFFVMCIVVVVVVVALTILLYRKSRSDILRPKKFEDGVFATKATFRRNSGDTGVYGNYDNGSIYLPPYQEKKPVDGDNYAHLEGGRVVDQEGVSTYETLHDTNTFTKENGYENPSVNDKKKDSDSEHEYEMADFSVSGQGPAYENPALKK